MSFCGRRQGTIWWDEKGGCEAIFYMKVSDSPIKMAKMFVHRWSRLPCILLFYFVSPHFLTVSAHRYGSQAKTLHLPPSESGLFHQGRDMHVFEVDPQRDPSRLMADFADGKKMESDFDGKRNRRSASADLSSSSLTNVTTAVSTKLSCLIIFKCFAPTWEHLWGWFVYATTRRCCLLVCIFNVY